MASVVPNDGSGDGGPPVGTSRDRPSLLLPVHQRVRMLLLGVLASRHGRDGLVLGFQRPPNFVDLRWLVLAKECRVVHVKRVQLVCQGALLVEIDGCFQLVFGGIVDIRL